MFCSRVEVLLQSLVGHRVGLVVVVCSLNMNPISR